MLRLDVGSTCGRVLDGGVGEQGRLPHEAGAGQGCRPHSLRDTCYSGTTGGTGIV